MKITLYTIGCPKCKVLEKKLELKNIEYFKEESLDIMMSKGIMSAPMLEVDGKLMNFSEAITFVNTLEG